MRLVIALLSLAFFLVGSAEARPRHHRHHHHVAKHHKHHARHHHRPVKIWSGHFVYHYRGGYGPKPRAWCGWYHRQQVGSDPGREYNRARAWAHWGRPARHGPGVTVVWPHHVGMIVGQCDGKMCPVRSGNDGNRVRTRVRSVARAIAFRVPG